MAWRRSLGSRGTGSFQTVSHPGREHRGFRVTLISTAEGTCPASFPSCSCERVPGRAESPGTAKDAVGGRLRVVSPTSVPCQPSLLKSV